MNTKVNRKENTTNEQTLRSPQRLQPTLSEQMETDLQGQGSDIYIKDKLN
jgi:hypothetical protein